MRLYSWKRSQKVTTQTNSIDPDLQSLEINNWVKNPSDKYNTELAHWCAKETYLNKRNLDKINTHKRLKLFVHKGLLNKFSPEQIAGRIKVLYPNDPIMSISYEAIY